MGGDCFEGVEKLTDQEYQHLVPEILSIIKPLYVRAEAYVALPEKTVHGDIDIMLILKPEVHPKQIIECLKIQRFNYNHNDTINSVYKNKQVDFCIKNTDREFEMTMFYKSYSGVGAHLGMFLPSKLVKLSDSGLLALAYREHIKFEFLITNSVEEILQFYGLDYGWYQQGFKTRLELFQYLRSCIFMDEVKMVQFEDKNRTKLTKFFIEYLKAQTNLREGKINDPEDPLQYTLDYFKKQEQFTKQYEDLLNKIEKKKNLNDKFNGSHLKEHFGVPFKALNQLKAKFKSAFQSDQEYEQYVQEHTLEQILMLAEQVLNMTPVIQDTAKMAQPLQQGGKKNRKNKKSEALSALSQPSEQPEGAQPKAQEGDI